MNTNVQNTLYRKGFGSTDFSIAIIFALVVIAVILGRAWMLNSQADTGTETTNIQTIISSTRGLMKTSGGYEKKDLTDTLVRVGGVSKSMTIDKSGTPYTVKNGWGGAVKVQGTGSNSFTVSTELVPMESCIGIATGIDRSGIVNQIKINSTTYASGKLTTTSASKSCKEDDGGEGQNTLTFKVVG